MDNTSTALEEKGLELSVDSGDQTMQATKEPNANIEDMDMYRKEIEHLMNLIVMPLIENPIGSPLIQHTSKEEPIVDVPHIDFIFGNQCWKLEDCTKIWQILWYISWANHTSEVNADIKRKDTSNLCGGNDQVKLP